MIEYEFANQIVRDGSDSFEDVFGARTPFAVLLDLNAIRIEIQLRTRLKKATNVK